MANTYTQIHLQLIFAVKYRTGLIKSHWKDNLYKYITGTIQMHHHKLLAINGMPDHVHAFIGMRPTQSLSDLMQDIKGSSSKWIDDQKLTRQKFEWQSGYAAFSYSRSQVDNIIGYINNQEEHHKKVSFQDEYLHMLDEFEVDYDNRYIFHSVQ